MAILIKRLGLFLILHLFIFDALLCNDFNLNTARKEFLLGNYRDSIDIASQIKTYDAKVFQSRIISIYSFFFRDEKEAKLAYLKAYEIAKKAIQEDTYKAAAYVEAAHALGRYGQTIGIMSALSEGIASRVQNYLDKALKIDDHNIIANLSKGIWHAEIINQAGKTLAKAIYGADINEARQHFTKVYNINNNEIGILYELAYGYHLLDTRENVNLSLSYIKSLMSKEAKTNIDNLYQKKALVLKERININR